MTGGFCIVFYYAQFCLQDCFWDMGGKKPMLVAHIPTSSSIIQAFALTKPLILI